MKVIDNFLPEENFKAITELVYDGYFPWYFQNKIAFAEEPGEKNGCFTHLIYELKPKSSHYEFIKDKLISHLNITNLIRIKVNCYPRTEKVLEHTKHYDYKFSNKAFILSLNTCNGFTVLENNKIASVRNRALFFDPSRLHCSTTCSDFKARFNINVNYN
jgi:hypothetical protein|tara:strand:+ start:308 stop:787 length:480 start_codon:yes stop_codon:yes gene_type:complete